MNTYISIDIETDGPVIGQNSMLSLGASAFRLDRSNGEEPFSTFSINIVPLPSAKPDPKTMTEFWDKQPTAWKAATENQVTASLAMKLFSAWLEMQDNKIIACYPASFDFPWVRYYLNVFANSDALGYECLDIKSLASGVLKTPFNKVKTSKLPDRWVQDKKNRVKHLAVDDAIAQGKLLMKILKEINIEE